MNIYKNVTELIGGTPLMELVNYERKNNVEATILAKLEYFNPAGSVKDRVAKSMIEDAEKHGILKKGSVIIERQAETPESVSRPSRRREGTGSSSRCPRP